MKAESSDRYFHHSCVSATFGNRVNLKHLHDFPQVTSSGYRITCYDVNIQLIRASLDEYAEFDGTENRHRS